MNSKPVKVFEYLLILILLTSSAFYGGYYFGKRGFVVEVKKNPPGVNVVNKEPKEQNVDFEIFWDVWDALNKYYYDRPLDGQKLIYGAVSGMVSAAGDDYTSFFNPVQNDVARSTLNGVYEGIGAELGFKDKQLVIISPLDGSPAQAMGVKAGDEIHEIEGVTTLGIGLSDAVSKIRGKAGTISTLKLRRGEGEPFEVKLKREKITSKSVTWKDLDDGVGYLRLARFGETTTEQWTEAVTEMVAQMPNLKGVVVDVRGNPGGYLTAATYISSEFLKAGQVVLYEEMADGTQIAKKVERRGLILEKPVVVLIDKGSASASEIVTGALKDNKRAQVVGVTSFGKGTIQSAIEFKDKTSLHVTVAKWLTPDKTWVHKTGIQPDFVVEITDEDVKESRDPQKDKAKEVILNVKK